MKHHSGPRGSYRVVPDSFRELLKKRTNWKKMIKTLNRLAFGGYTCQNYNGQSITAEPNLEALKLLIMIAWGKPGTDVEKGEEAEILKQFLSIVSPPANSTMSNPNEETNSEKIN